MQRFTLVVMVGIVVLAARAEADVIARGYVVRIEAGEVYFDIGKGSGLAPGAPVRIKRPVVLKHPVTGKDVRDELPVVELTVRSVGETLSMTLPRGDLADPVQVGDIVEAYIVKDAPVRQKQVVKPATPPPTPEEPLPTIDEETARVLHLWASATGRPVADQIATWETYLIERPDSPFAATLREDLERLRAFQKKLGDYQAEAVSTEPQVSGVAHNARTRANHHERLPLTFAAEDPSAIRAAWLHFRKRGSETFRKSELRRDGDAYLRGDIAADVVESPGVEYFVEVATAEGLVGSAIGTPSQPVFVPVEAARTTEIFRETKRRSRVSVRATYLDYATFDPRTGATTDTFLLFEADFLYRLYRTPYAVRVGFGSLHGKGGIEAPVGMNAAPKTGFNYGYWEMEFRGKYNLAYMGRLVVGAGEDGFGAGVEGRIRLGPETGTNLTFAASTLEGIGFLSELHLQWAAFAKVPLGFGVALTNQPLGDDGDLGVRFSADIGVHALDWFQPTLRVSYQGRTVEHSGVGGGLGLVFDW